MSNGLTSDYLHELFDWFSGDIWFNPWSAKLHNLNFHPPEVVPRYRGRQLQVGENNSYVFNLIIGPHFFIDIYSGFRVELARKRIIYMDPTKTRVKKKIWKWGNSHICQSQHDDFEQVIPNRLTAGKLPGDMGRRNDMITIAINYYFYWSFFNIYITEILPTSEHCWNLYE